jgi:hypothetical protein
MVWSGAGGSVGLLPQSPESNGDSLGQVSQGFFDAQGRIHLRCLVVGIFAAEFLNAELVGVAVGAEVLVIYRSSRFMEA